MNNLDCFCDYDPATFYTKHVYKARKVHRCEECNREIRPGEMYEYVSGLWGRDFWIFKTCNQCVDLRTWVKNNVPCLCWAHGSLIDDCELAIDDAIHRAPTETIGLRFGFLRRKIERAKQ